jgi:hypothetical protein
MALQAAPSSKGVPRPTRGEGRATGRAVTGGGQNRENKGSWRCGLRASRRETMVGARTIGHRGGGG